MLNKPKMKKIIPNVERIVRDIDRLSEITLQDERQARYTRISFSKEDLEARNYIASLMETEAGLKVRVDAVGNLIGRREGKVSGPAILVGSHLDTVMGGGRFDGIAGVVAGLEVARLFNELNVDTEFPLEVVAFVAEEPSPFGLSCIGSRAMEGGLTSEHLALQDGTGRTLAQAIDEIGGDSNRVFSVARQREEVLSNFELHIDQGPVLENERIPIGVVTGIVGIHRGTLEIIGRADHSGTTPMETRTDALAAAAEAVLAFEKICREALGVVGTIGKLDVFPNSLNVVPGTVSMGLEVRSLKDNDSSAVLSRFGAEMQRIRIDRGIGAEYETKRSSHPVVFNSRIVKLMESVCGRLSIPYMLMPSGAGHDASHMAKITDSSMIFIPSKGGRSHCPEEWSDFEHLAKGIEVLVGMILATDKEGRV